MHEAVIAYVYRYATPMAVSVLDIGGRNLNGTTRALYPNADPYHVLDIRPDHGTDIVADAATWTPDRQYDFVLCTEVFEHTPDWAAICETILKALKPGGVAIMTCAGPGRPPHSAIEATGITPGEYYENVASEELHAVLVALGFNRIECHTAGLDTQATAYRPLEAPAPPNWAKILLDETAG